MFGFQRLMIGAGYDIADRALAGYQFEAQLGRNALNGNSAALRDSASAFGASGEATTYDLATGLFSTYDPQTESFSNVSNNFPRLTAGVNEIRFGAGQLNPLAAINGETAVYIGSFIVEEAFAGGGASAASRRTGAYRFDDMVRYADDVPFSNLRRAPKAGVTHGLEYHPRIAARALQDPVGHGFPRFLDDAILSTKGVKLPSGATGYAVRGSRGKERGRSSFFWLWWPGAMLASRSRASMPEGDGRSSHAHVRRGAHTGD